MLVIVEDPRVPGCPEVTILADQARDGRITAIFAGYRWQCELLRDSLSRNLSDEERAAMELNLNHLLVEAYSSEYAVAKAQTAFEAATTLGLN